MRKVIQAGLLAILSIVGSAEAVTAFSDPALPSFETFLDWCSHKAELSPAARHTVEVLLQQADTQACKQAQGRLSTLTQLFLDGNALTDLRPVASLTNLRMLDLRFNQITDVTPLAPLKNLT